MQERTMTIGFQRPTPSHPLVACAEEIERALKDVSHVEPAFMSTADKADVLVRLGALVSQVEALQLRVLAHSDDVAERDAASDAGNWLSHKARIDRAAGRRQVRLAGALERRWTHLGAAVLDGRVNLAQAEVLVRALDQLPGDVDPEVTARAEQHLIREAASFGPRSLRVLGRRVLDIVAPEVADDAEGKALEREDREAAKKAFVRSWRRGDGTTELRLRVSDAVAHRFLTYLEAFSSPRREAVEGASTTHPDDRRSYPQRLAHAFGAFLEAVDPARLPLHGGDATTLVVTIDIDTLRGHLSQHGVALLGDEPISAGQARRLACTANILPAVLGGDSQILDLGRTRRLFSPPQRKAMAVRDVTCRADGCDIPAAWCEAHHLTPWSRGGRTDLADGVLLCSFHHHRAHEERYDTRRGPDGRFTFHRRP
jgi:hypothetical protein